MREDNPHTVGKTNGRQDSAPQQGHVWRPAKTDPSPLETFFKSDTARQWQRTKQLQEYKSLLDKLGIPHDPPSKEALCFADVSDEQVVLFLECLKREHTARRLREEILPHCDVPNLARFLVLAVHPGIEARFIDGKEGRGRAFKIALRACLRKSPTDSDKVLLSRAETAYNTRRDGLTSSALLLIVREYVHFRSGTALRPADWGALLKATYHAARRQIRADKIDGELLARNLRNLAKRHPGRVPTGIEAAAIVEIRLA